MTSEGAAPWAQSQRASVVARLGAHLYTYLNNYAEPSEHRSILAGFLQLDKRDLDALIDERLVLDRRVQEFIHKDVPALLRSPAKSSSARYDEGLGRIRGRPDWQRTIRGRMEQGGLDVPLFVWASIERLYDLPENRLVKYVLQVLSQVGHRTANVDFTYREGTYSEAAATLALQSEQLLAHVILRGLSTVSIPSSDAKSRAGSHRVAGYRAAARLFDLLEAARWHGSTPQADLLAEAYLVPLDDDRIFELFVLTKVIDAMLSSDWEIRRIRAIGGSRGPAFELVRGDARAEVLFQSTPGELVEMSRYKQLFAGTGIQLGARRPDIVIRVSRRAERWIGLIEVKFSAWKPYITDGIYKCLGYLRDFSAILDPQQPAPLALLVCWAGVPTTVSASTPSEVSVATASRLASSLNTFIETGASSIGFE